ncbi:MAG: sigma-54-dependent Fis family transcriptional regulator, partial [Aliifodinibius sp.]|nr:sigma-54-dependent Fis family transcriptional regulator [Fodinibius sp.]
KDHKIKALSGTTDKTDRQSSSQENDGEIIQPREKRFIGEDEQIKKLMEILPQIAASTAPVMIQGESGTGKEVFANLIHENS